MDKFSNEDMAKFMMYVQSQFAAEAEKATSAEVTTTKVADSPKPEMQATAYQTDNNDEENINLKNDFMIEERARSLASQEKFYEAASQCEDLMYIVEANVGLKLLIAECYVQLGRESKAERAIRDVEKILQKPPMFDIDDVLDLAKDYSDNSSYIRALLLLRIAFDVLMKDSSLSADEKVDHGFRCLSKMDDVMDAIESTQASEDDQNMLAIQKALAAAAGVNMQKMFGSRKKLSEISERTRVLYLDYGVEVMEEMLEKIEPMKNSDPETKAIKLARFANAISLHYKAFRQFSKAFKVLQFTIDQLDKQFGKNARQYGIYGTTLFNIGSDYHISEKFKEAESYTIRAIEALEYAMDFGTEEGKRQGIKGMEEGLRKIQSNLKLA